MSSQLLVSQWYLSYSRRLTGTVWTLPMNDQALTSWFGVKHSWLWLLWPWYWAVPAEIKAWEANRQTDRERRWCWSNFKELSEASYRFDSLILLSKKTFEALSRGPWCLKHLPFIAHTELQVGFLNFTQTNCWSVWDSHMCIQCGPGNDDFQDAALPVFFPHSGKQMWQ